MIGMIGIAGGLIRERNVKNGTVNLIIDAEIVGCGIMIQLFVLKRKVNLVHFQILTKVTRRHIIITNEAMERKRMESTNTNINPFVMAGPTD